MLPTESLLPANVTQAPPDRTETTALPSGQLGQQDFLRMLIAQLENQDPLNPQESTDFTAQLAQFSSLEQLISMRTGIEEMTSFQKNDRSLEAVGLIGRQVLAEGSQFALESGASQSLSFDLQGRSDSTLVKIRNASGSQVAEINLGSRPSGRGNFQWDGRNDRGVELPAGIYSFEVSALHGVSPVTAVPLVESRVTGATLSGESPVLMLGDVVVPLSSIREVRQVAELAEEDPS